MKLLIKAAESGTTLDLINALSRRIKQIQEAPMASVEIDDLDDEIDNTEEHR